MRMKTNKEIRLENSRALMEEVGGQARFCERTGKSQSQISAVMGATVSKGIGDELAREFEEEFKREQGWLDHEHQLNAAMNNKGEHNKSDVISIKQMDVDLSMGTGLAAPDREEIIDHLTIRRRWLVENFIISAQSNLRLTTGIGDSMAPTITDGDIILIDTGIVEIKIDAIFVMERDGELFIKRIQRMLDGSFLVISDNRKAYDPYPMAKSDFSNIRVCGRALMVWNGRKL